MNRTASVHLDTSDPADITSARDFFVRHSRNIVGAANVNLPTGQGRPKLTALADPGIEINRGFVRCNDETIDAQKSDTTSIVISGKAIGEM